MHPSLYDHAGGAAAFGRLAHAHHARCLADPELNHPFTHSDLNPQHVERLAAYWAEVLGGPSTYSALPGAGQVSLLRMHAGCGDVSDLGRRFVAYFLAAADDVGLPDDPEFRSALRSYMEWAVQETVLRYPDSASDVPAGVPVPRWGWDGLESD
jgi:hemoglobin